MILVAWRGLFSRKLRTVLTAIAIVLGVSMIAGTYVLTDTINSSFSAIFHTADRHIDAVISGKAAVQSQYSRPPSLPASLLGTVQGTPGVAAAEGEIGDTGALFNQAGTPLGSTGGAPTLLFSLPSPRFRSSSLVAGHWPVGNQIVVDKDTFQRYHLHLGQTVYLAAARRKTPFILSGSTRFGSVGSIGGATVIDMPLAAAQRVTGKVGRYDQISVAAASGVVPRALVRRIEVRIPTGLKDRVKVRTGEQNAQDQTQQIGTALNFLTIALLAFGGIAVFVGAFIIFNTFSITVAQRAREFALLRTVGASRGQVLRSVILEALLLGIGASIVGLLAGLGIAKGLNRLFVAFGVDLPNAGQVIETRTVVVALLVGTLVTLAAGIMPAIRATRVPPIAALREGAQLPRGRFAPFTPWIAGILSLLGIAVLAVGIDASISSTGQRLSLIGLGAVLLFLGVALLSPRLVTPLAAIIGWPIERTTRITGRLARENTVRNPSRTAVTAAALMIGLALVGFVTIFAAELRTSAYTTIKRDLAGEFVIDNDSFGLIPGGVAPAIARVPGVQVASPLKQDSASITGIGDTTVDGIQPATFGQVYHFQWKAGSNAVLRNLGPHDAIIGDTFGHGIRVGSMLHLTTPAGRHDTFTVRGIIKNTQLASLLVPYDSFARDWQQPKDAVVYVAAVPGQNLATLQHHIAAVLRGQYPTATVHSQAGVVAQEDKGVNQLVSLIYVLLAMSVIVSLFGIINTLVLSVYERTREIGMLRAIGTTRRQIRAMVRWESVITSVIGAVLGLLLGIVLAALVTAGLASQGIEFALPIGQLLLWVVVAIIFGVVAAVWPARRAARLDVLQAVAYE